GAALTYATSGTISAGTASFAFRASLPGDMPGYGVLTLDDVGGTVAPINGWIIGQNTVPAGWNASGTLFAPQALMGTAGIGVGTTDSSYYAGTIYVSAVPDQDWQTFAQVYQPTGSLNHGLFDVYGKVRDNAVILDAPSNVTAVGRTFFSTSDLIDGHP